MERKIYTLGLLNTQHFTAYLDEVALRTGKRSRRLKIDHPEAVAVVPFIDPENIIMVRQWRYAIGQETLEIPAGKVDPGETIEDAVHRELMEETGYRASLLKPVISYFPAIAYSSEIIHIFSAENLTALEKKSDEDEISSVETVSIKDAIKMIREGFIKDGKTILGLFLVWANGYGQLSFGNIP